MADEVWIDLYQELELWNPFTKEGTGPRATIKEIKAQHRKLISKKHSDRHERKSKWVRQTASERSKRLNFARDILTDPETRAEYDREWLKRNPEFEKQEKEAKEKASKVAPQISVRWDPPEIQSDVFYNIPRGEKRRAKLIVNHTAGGTFTVEIREPRSGWLKIVEPVNRKGILVPKGSFTAVVEVDTSKLQYDQPYSDDLIFVVEEP